MLDRINTKCPQCGKYQRGVVCLVTDPSVTVQNPVRAYEFSDLPIRASCLGCSFYTVRWVDTRALQLLVRSWLRIDTAAYRAVSQLGIYPTRWKVWRAGTRSRYTPERERLVRIALCAMIPDVWGWFNGASIGASSEISENRDSSRSEYIRWMLDRFSTSPECRSLWRAVLLSKGSVSINSTQLFHLS